MLALAGCAGHYFVQRDPWRKEAEVACLKSGAVRESGTVVRIQPINGPGMCGADFPMKVAALGDSPMLSYSEGLRPPGDVPNAGPQRWPVTSEPRYAPPPRQAYPAEQQYSNPMRPSPVQRQPLYPSGSGASNAAAPMQITPSTGDNDYDRAGAASAQSGYGRSGPAGAQDDYMRAGSPDAQPDYRSAPSTSSRRASVYDAPPLDGGGPPRTTSAAMPRQQPPFRGMPSQAQAPVSVPLGGAVAAVGPVEIKPAATLACPIVSALDRWILDSVQPAAQRWFRQPVTEIRQISAYSCRGMNGQAGAKISEHAFGNALDIAAFVLADGRRITVKNGWKGSPEEQGFLRDVQGAACDQFNTVLAPGSNRFHYDHIHVDLMRRASGHKICNPDQIPGDVVAARVAKERGYAWRPDSGVTGSVGKTRRASLNGGPKKSKVRNILSADDDDWIEDEGPRPAH